MYPNCAIYKINDAFESVFNLKFNILALCERSNTVLFDIFGTRTVLHLKFLKKPPKNKYGYKHP